MFQPRSYNNFPKEPAKRQNKQQNPKGCCCKRSQCIKNYCDCYQSMTTCSVYCKCIGKSCQPAISKAILEHQFTGCRNTEERLALADPPKKSALTAKRERAAALSAKAAAAAAKAGINIHMKPAPGSASYVVERMTEQLAIPAPVKSQEVKLPAGDLDSFITFAPPNATTLVNKPQQAVPTVSQTPVPPKDGNILKQPVNAAMLECVLIQAADAEAVGLNEAQVAQVVIYEFARNLQAIINVYGL